MKNIAAFSLGLLLLATACKEDTETSVKVTYEVITTEGDWFGEYKTEFGNVCVCQPPLEASGWTYTFMVPSTPFELHVDASSECCAGQEGSPDVTTNIYVDDKLVATNTSNWAPGLASADYTVK